jgi:hypothetical protein
VLSSADSAVVRSAQARKVNSVRLPLSCTLDSCRTCCGAEVFGLVPFAEVAPVLTFHLACGASSKGQTSTTP